MAFQGVTDATQVDQLIKNLASGSGAQVLRNAPNTTPVIANNGNL